MRVSSPGKAAEDDVTKLVKKEHVHEPASSIPPSFLLQVPARVSALISLTDEPKEVLFSRKLLLVRAQQQNGKWDRPHEENVYNFEEETSVNLQGVPRAPNRTSADRVLTLCTWV